MWGSKESRKVHLTIKDDLQYINNQDINAISNCFSSYNILLRTTWLLQNNIRAMLLIRERQLTRRARIFHYEFSNKKMFGSSLPPALCRMVHVLVTLFENSCVQHMLCFCFVFLRLVWPRLWCQYLFIVYFWLFVWYIL